MGTGILVCGLNGCGKSTLGRALANELGYHFIDVENLYFPKSTSGEAYTDPLSHEEVQKLLQNEVAEHPDFVFAAVKGDFGENIIQFFNHIILIEVPKDIRAKRIRERSFAKFGTRMLPGGDLYEQEESFFRMADARTDDHVENWLRTLIVPVIKVDGTRPTDENISIIANTLH